MTKRSDTQQEHEKKRASYGPYMSEMRVSDVVGYVRECESGVSVVSTIYNDNQAKSAYLPVLVVPDGRHDLFRGQM